MHPLIEQHREQIAAACLKHGVKKLEIFGSAARGEPVPNDFDFFVEYLDYDSPSLADQWFGLQEDLFALLGKPVDLVSPRRLRNPYFIESANADRTTLYAA